MRVPLVQAIGSLCKKTVSAVSRLSPERSAFEIVNVSTLEPSGAEPMGSKQKVWFADPAVADIDSERSRSTWLFKQVRVKEMPDGNSRTFGEDWSEKLASELATLMGVPAAKVELAERGGERGSLSHTVLPDVDSDLVHGNELLQAHDPAYVMEQRREAAGYTLAAVRQALHGYAPPPGLPLESAWDAFVGYLLFDALLANTDRHHENWAVVAKREGVAWLSPSFDHATSLGFQISDDQRASMLADPGAIDVWLARGRSSHFEGKPQLVDLAATALDMTPAETRDYWCSKVRSLDLARWQATISRVPAGLMSQVERKFAFEIVRRNRERVLRVCWPD